MNTNNLKLILAAASVVSVVVQADYVLDEVIGGKGDDFFSHFNYFTGGDPTHGFVDFQGPGTGLSVQDASGVTFLKTDTTQNAGSHGRKAIRLESKKNWSKGLFIIDLGHLPASVCGSWPAWWFNGKGSRTWPATGEIDVIEYTNTDHFNHGTLHTAPGCYLTSKTGVDMSGQALNTDCGAGGGYTGCGAKSPDNRSAGDGFNNAGAGLYVVEFNFDQQWPIKMWSFVRSEIPEDIKNGNPDPTSWKLPYAMFKIGATCPNDFFDRQTMIFDQTFCGDWAGDRNVWNGSGCAASTGYPQCVDYVRENGHAFQDAFFAVNDIKIYQWDASPAPPPAPVPTPCTPQEQDPWASGSFVACCGGSGFQECLRKSAGWSYRCQPCSQSCQDDSDWNKRCGRSTALGSVLAQLVSGKEERGGGFVGIAGGSNANKIARLVRGVYGYQDGSSRNQRPDGSWYTNEGEGESVSSSESESSSAEEGEGSD